MDFLGSFRPQRLREEHGTARGRAADVGLSVGHLQLEVLFLSLGFKV